MVFHIHISLEGEAVCNFSTNYFELFINNKTKKKFTYTITKHNFYYLFRINNEINLSHNSTKSEEKFHELFWFDNNTNSFLIAETLETDIFLLLETSGLVTSGFWILVLILSLGTMEAVFLVVRLYSRSGYRGVFHNFTLLFGFCWRFINSAALVVPTVIV